MINNPDFLTKTKFLIKDIFPAAAAKYTSGVLAFLIFSFSLMSFTNSGDVSKGKNISNNPDSSLISKKFETLLLTNSRVDTSNYIPLNEQALSFANNFINEQAPSYNKMKNWGKPYFILFDKILSSNGLPVELKYLSVIESDLRGNLASDAGAVGPWQLMPDEAKRFHLKMNDEKDERMDFAKSTQVACKLLKELHTQFGDWLLAIAAYNCGAGRMKQAIAKAGSDNFWKLQYFLPEETRNHVKKYIAADYYFEKTGGFTTMTADEIVNYLAVQTQKLADTNTFSNLQTITISGKYQSSVIADNLSMKSEDFKALNPDFDKTISTGAAFDLKLPSDKANLFNEKKKDIIHQSVSLLLASSR